MLYEDERKKVDISKLKQLDRIEYLLRQHTLREGKEHEHLPNTMILYGLSILILSAIGAICMLIYPYTVFEFDTLISTGITLGTGMIVFGLIIQIFVTIRDLSATKTKLNNLNNMYKKKEMELRNGK